MSERTERLESVLGELDKFLEQEPPQRLYYGAATDLAVGSVVEPSEHGVRSGWFDYIHPDGMLILTPDRWDAFRHTMYYEPPGGVYEVEAEGRVEPQWAFNVLREALPAKNLPPRWLAESVRITDHLGPGLSAHHRGAVKLLQDEVGRRLHRDATDHELLASFAEVIRKRGRRLGLQPGFVSVCAAAAEMTALRDGPEGQETLRLMRELSGLRVPGPTA